MSTDYLVREEMHDRVDTIFDEIEAGLDEDDESVALIGQMVDGVNVSGPREGRSAFEADPTVAYAPFSFESGDAYPLGEAFRDLPNRELVSTVVVAKSSLHPTLGDAIDGDEDARETIANGELVVADGGDD